MPASAGAGAAVAGRRPAIWIGLGALALVGGVLALGRSTPRAPLPGAGAPRTASGTPVKTTPAVATTAVTNGPALRDAETARQGVQAYARGDMGAALAAFQAAVAAEPQDPESANNLGQVLVRLGRVDEALPHFDAAIALAPQTWSYRFNRARARGLAGDWAGAVEGYREADQLFPDDHVTLFNLGLALRKTGQHAEAAEALERAVAQAPDDPSLLLPLGSSYEAAGRQADAARIYAQYLQASPEGRNAAAVKARLTRLTGAEPRAGQPAEAPGA